MQIKNRFFLLLFILVLNLLPFKFAQANVLLRDGNKPVQVRTPLIIEIDHSSPETISRPLVRGVTPANTEVLVYLDDKFAGLAHLNSQGTESDNFYYQPPNVLDEGSHEIMVVARDKTSLLLSPPSDRYGIFVIGLPAPTLIQPSKELRTQKVKPIISGLTKSGTFVHIYIDGVYNGETQIVEHESGTANFAYEPFLNLNVGQHEVVAVAEDSSGRKSKLSGILRFNIEQKLPAPVIFQPVVNNQSQPEQPFIIGNVKNNLKVRVYIDRVLDGEFRVTNNESGTANFAYKPFLPLKSGEHVVYTEAVDATGKISQWSNIIFFSTSRVKKPAISDEGVSEGAEAQPGQAMDSEDNADKNANDKEPIQSEQETEKTDQSPNEVSPENDNDQQADLNDIEDILQGESDEQGDSGLLNESKEKQSKLNVNLIIFILFLIAVIAWIFWVNRELIREKRQQNEEKEKQNDKNNPTLNI